jgi:8-oxo-dGTP diphosphatase
MCAMTIAVVAAALVQDGRVLAARRVQPARLAGGWEFPGGKVEPGESEVSALVRELREELGVDAAVGARLGEAADGTVTLAVYAATLVAGRPRPMQDHDRLRWLAAAELADVAWLPADRLLLPLVADFLTDRPGTPPRPG